MLATSQNSMGAVRRKTRSSFAGGQLMESVSAFVEEGFDVALQAGGVHEDEGLAGFFQGHEIAAGLFSLAALEIEISVLLQLIEIGSQFGREAIEDFAGFADENIDLVFVERVQRWPALGIDG